MDIRALSDAAGKRVQGNTPQEAEKYMANIRSNLFNLLCRSDEAKAETISDLSVYGGRESVETAIARAIANLLALGHVFGADVAGRIIKLLSPEGQQPGTTALTSADTTTPPAKQANEKAGTTTGSPAQSDTGAKAKSDAATSGSAGDDASYKARFDAAKTDGELKAIWKEIQVNKTLVGVTKHGLYQYMVDAKKKLK